MFFAKNDICRVINVCTKFYGPTTQRLTQQVSNISQ